MAVEKESIDVNINLSKAEGKCIVWKQVNLKWQQCWEQEVREDIYFHYVQKWLIQYPVEEEGGKGRMKSLFLD